MTTNKTQHPDFQTKTDDGLPVWPSLRTIDGYHYLLDSQHASVEAAQAAVQKIRATGDAAQCFTAGNPKFNDMGEDFAGPGGQRLYAPAIAAVYTIPKGKRIELTDDGHQVNDRPAPEPKPTKATKSTAKPAKAKAKPKTKGKAKAKASKAQSSD